MHHFAVSPPKSPFSSNGCSQFSLFPQNPDPVRFHSFYTYSSKTHKFSVFNCKGIEVSVLNHRSNSTNSGNGSLRSERLKSVGAKDIDIATLGNLCVDIVLNVPQLPPTSFQERKAYMEQLSSSPPDKRYWEAGGMCNTAIAAARLGLHCVAIGHVGNEIYGKFLLDVLHEEGVGMVGISEDLDAVDSHSVAYETLLCWVLVDPLQRHGFCSRADFSKEPAFSWINSLTEEVKVAIKRSKVLFVNGYGFDEFSPSLLVSALKYAVEVGTSVFFDPGPRGKSLSTGTPEEQMALSEFLKMSDVLLLTSDEAEALTGIGNPILAGQELLKRSSRTKWVTVKMGCKGSILITLSSISCAPAFKVKIIDTVGCGDSYVAAVVFGFVHKMPMVHTLAFANAVGAATAMGCGAGRNVATLDRVKELILAGDLNEADEFWKEFLNDFSDDQEITLLSRMLVNGGMVRLNQLSLHNVFPELLSKLTPSEVEGVLHSRLGLH
ncbi:hypothetical protein Ancab_020189 [Ancistrocladus abbreviatus]